MDVSPSPRQPIGFFGIPLELRHQVYQDCLVHKNTVKVDEISVDGFRLTERGICDKRKSLLFVSKRVGWEAVKILYGDNVFQVLVQAYGEDCLKKYFSEANRRRIRRIQVVMQPEGRFHFHMPDPRIWSPVLVGLTRVSIVAQQPLQAQVDYDIVTFRKHMHNWMAWVRKFLQCIARQLSSSCKIEVDDDDRKETTALMKQFFRGRFRKVQTLEGDMYFRRNQYSDESGYWG